MSSRNQRRNKKPTRNGSVLERPAIVLDENLYPHLLEARGGRRGNTPLKSFSLAWDETEALGITADMRRSGPGMLSDQDRKEVLYKAYLQSVWISACIDVIAKRITSGGMVIELAENGKENQAEYDRLHEFLHYINEDEDFLQLIRSIVTDILIYGECYLEIVRKSGVPFSLHKIDCSTMNYTLDQHGTVISYTQNMMHSTETVPFQPEDVIRWWLPDPKASKKALSPIERIMGAIDADVHMADWVRAFFRKGARPPFWIKFPGSKEEAGRFVVWLRENYTGQANAHIPLVLYDEAELHEVGKGTVDVDFLKGREQMCKEILAAYQVPPAIVGLIESGNIGGGTGESQDKSFQFNACDPLRQMIFEKFNYRILRKGFSITNYQVNTRYGDFRSDLDVVKVDDTRIRNGSETINEVRANTGKSPVDGGDEAVVVASRDVIPVSRLQALSDEQTQQAGIAAQQAQAQLDMAKVQIDKAKEPPPIIQQVAPDNTEKPPEDDRGEQQERHLLALQQALARVNDALVRTDEHLRVIREEKPALSEEDKQRLIEIWQGVKSQKDWYNAMLPYVNRERESQNEGHGTQETLHTQNNEEISTIGDIESTMDLTHPDLSENTAQQEPVSVESNRPAILEQHTGMMVAFMLDAETANQLALPGGEPAESLHCTLAFLGDIGDDARPGMLHPAQTRDTIRAVLAQYASVAKPIEGRIGGLARFTPSPSSDDRSPVIALINAPGLQEWRRQLVIALNDAGYSVADDFDFTSHVTLVYLKDEDPMPIDNLSGEIFLKFDTLCLAIGDDRYYFKIGDEQYPSEDTKIQDPIETALTQWRENIFSDMEQGPSISLIWQGLTTTSIIPQPLYECVVASLSHCETPENVVTLFDRIGEEQKHQPPDYPLIYNAKRDVWEPHDTTQQIERYQVQGVEYLKWVVGESLSGPCTTCFSNSNEVRRIGEAYPNGSILPGAHPRCSCKTVPCDEKGEVS